MAVVTSKLVLASGSARRIALLQQIGIEPALLCPTDIDETPKKSDMPRALAIRLAREKAEAAMHDPEVLGLEDDFYLLAADTVVGVGRRILPKAETLDEAADCLRLLSGRSHRVYTSVCLVTPTKKIRQRTIETRIRFKRFSRDDVEAYLVLGEWRGKAGGYAIQGFAEAYVQKIVGSYSNVVGLPLHETFSLLVGEGYPAYQIDDDVS